MVSVSLPGWLHLMSSTIPRQLLFTTLLAVQNKFGVADAVFNPAPLGIEVDATVEAGLVFEIVLLESGEGVLDSCERRRGKAGAAMTPGVDVTGRT